MTSDRAKLLLGAFFVLMGLMIVMAAFGVGPMSGSKVHAPRWVIGVCGVVFASCGVVLNARSQAIRSLGAGLVVIGLAMAFGWVALFGEARYFSGGSPLLTRAAEVLVARVLFASVAALGIGIAVNAVRKALGGRDA